MRRTKPDRFLAGICIDEGAALLVDSAETVHVAPTFFDQNEWCLEGDFGDVGSPQWIFVLFDDPSDMPGLVRSATACRIEMVSERELRVFGRGDPLGLAPVAVVSDPETIQPKTHAVARPVDFLDSGPALDLFLVQQVPDLLGSLRVLSLHEGVLYSSIQETLPESLCRPMISFGDPYEGLPTSVPLLTAGEALIRLAGNAYERSWWRVDNGSFDQAWEEHFAPRQQ